MASAAWFSRPLLGGAARCAVAVHQPGSFLEEASRGSEPVNTSAK
jgi:hypothetical protein